VHTNILTVEIYLEVVCRGSSEEGKLMKLAQHRVSLQFSVFIRYLQIVGKTFCSVRLTKNFHSVGYMNFEIYSGPNSCSTLSLIYTVRHVLRD
jgi:hypothetical protein